MRPKTVPIREIQFAAKMGFLSKRLWLDFFTKKSASQNCRRWQSFISEKYFKAHESKSLSNVLILDKKSRALLETLGLGAVTPPHMNQVDHDEIVARILVQLEARDEILSIKTESELKKKFMLWMRTTREGRGVKFPDLSVTFNEQAKFPRIAFEVELSKKNFERCKTMMVSYSTKNEIDAVVFIAEQQAIFDRLARAMKETHYPSWERPVGFSHLKGWMTDPTTAPIYMSEGVASLELWMSVKTEKAS